MKIRTPIRPLRIVDRRRTYLPHLLAIALLWTLAMTLDYHDQAAAENERAESWKSQMSECLNGRWRGITSDGTQVGCMPAEEFSPSERSRPS